MSLFLSIVFFFLIYVQRKSYVNLYFPRSSLIPGSRQNKAFFNPGDTNALVAAVAFGKGLSKCRPPGPVPPGHPGQGPLMSGGPTLQQVTIGGGAGQQAGLGGPVAPQQQGQPGRRPGLGFPPGSERPVKPKIANI